MIIHISNLDSWETCTLGPGNVTGSCLFYPELDYKLADCDMRSQHSCDIGMMTP